jgi:hypothetical protein
MGDFELHKAPQIVERLAADERRYGQYVNASLDLEDQMREARTVLRRTMPEIQHQMSVLARAGVSRIGGPDVLENSSIDQLAAAVDQQFQALPDTMRCDAELSIRREQRERDRVRESISMGGR